MKKFYPLQVINLRFHVHHVNTKKILLFDEYRGSPDNDHVDDRFYTFLNQT